MPNSFEKTSLSLNIEFFLCNNEYRTFTSGSLGSTYLSIMEKPTINPLDTPTKRVIKQSLPVYSLYIFGCSIIIPPDLIKEINRHRHVLNFRFDRQSWKWMTRLTFTNRSFMVITEEFFRSKFKKHKFAYGHDISEEEEAMYSYKDPSLNHYIYECLNPNI